MVACLEKSDENVEFHQIVDFLSTCSINYALTVSPTIYASYIELFWNTATSKTINYVKQIYAIVDGKDVVISKSSMRNDLLFNDENAPQTEAHQTAVSQIVFHEAHIEQIIPSPTTYQRKRKTQKHRRTKKDTELPQTSVRLDPRADEAVYKEGVTVWKGLSLLSERVLEQPNEPPLSEGHTSGSGEGSMEQTFELTDNVPSAPHDSPLTGGYTPRSDEGRIKLDELITLCTKLSKQVLDLEKEKDAQAVEILNLKKRGRRSDKLKPMFKDKDFEELDDQMENVEEETVDAAATGVSTVSAPISTAGVTISIAESRTPPTTTVFDDEDRSDQGDLKIQEAELAQRLHEEELTENVIYLASIDADALFAAKLQQEEREQFTIEGKSIIFGLGNNSSTKECLECYNRDCSDQNKPPTEELVEESYEEQDISKRVIKIAAAPRYEHEKEELRMWLTVLSDEEEIVDPMILEFDRQDLVDLHRLVMKRFEEYPKLWSSYITDGWYFDSLQHASREKVIFSQGRNAEKMFKLKLEAEAKQHNGICASSSLSSHRGGIVMEIMRTSTKLYVPADLIYYCYALEVCAASTMLVLERSV
ncbi:hypothetical protein Tco_0601612 [Tanacetum coccineum]